MLSKRFLKISLTLTYALILTPTISAKTYRWETPCYSPIVKSSGTPLLHSDGWSCLYHSNPIVGTACGVSPVPPYTEVGTTNDLDGNFLFKTNVFKKVVNPVAPEGKNIVWNYLQGNGPTSLDISIYEGKSSSLVFKAFGQPDHSEIKMFSLGDPAVSQQSKHIIWTFENMTLFCNPFFSCYDTPSSSPMNEYSSVRFAINFKNQIVSKIWADGDSFLRIMVGDKYSRPSLDFSQKETNGETILMMKKFIEENSNFDLEGVQLDELVHRFCVLSEDVRERERLWADSQPERDARLAQQKSDRFKRGFWAVLICISIGIFTYIVAWHGPNLKPKLTIDFDGEGE